MSAEAAPPLPSEGPVFAEPWEAQAFAITVSLHARGLFTWPEWAQALAAQIAARPGDGYYAQWLAALEGLVAAKGATSAEELARTRDAWERAAERTPHGQPIELQARDFDQSLPSSTA